MIAVTVKIDTGNIGNLSDELLAALWYVTKRTEVSEGREQLAAALGDEIISRWMNAGVMIR